MARPAPLPLFPARGKPRIPPARKPPAPKEITLQMSVAYLLRRLCRPEWRWTHFPAGELRDEATAKKLRAMGLQRGWPDILLIDPIGRLHALELKRRGETLSHEQEAFRAWCCDHGVPHAVADDLRGATEILTSWGALRELGAGDAA
jgi:hypothetical protein